MIENMKSAMIKNRIQSDILRHRGGGGTDPSGIFARCLRAPPARYTKVVNAANRYAINDSPMRY